MKKYIVLDLYIFNDQGQILVNSKSAGTEFNSQNLRPIILYAENGFHPIVQIKDYLREKNFQTVSVRLLPSLLLNKFDSEPEEDYLVLCFRAEVKTDQDFHWVPDDMNQSASWMDLQDFANHKNLLPELKDSLFLNIIEGKEVYYSGQYMESDGSNRVISKEVYKSA